VVLYGVCSAGADMTAAAAAAAADDDDDVGV